MSASLAYRTDIAKGLAFATRLENDYVGARTDATYAINNLASYDLTNFRAGVEGERWNAALFVRNVFNERAILSNGFQINVNVPTFNRAVVSQPLTVGLDLRYHF